MKQKETKKVKKIGTSKPRKPKLGKYTVRTNEKIRQKSKKDINKKWKRFKTISIAFIRKVCACKKTIQDKQ